jgi:hypothetical protein
MPSRLESKRRVWVGKGWPTFRKTTNHSGEDIKPCHATGLQDIKLIYGIMNKAGATPI